MRSFARDAPRFSLTCVVLAFFAAAALEGCGGRPSEQQAVDEFFKNNSKSKQEAVARFAGRVTVDGLPPSRQLSRLFVILSDPQKLEKPKDGSIRFASCDEQGNFEFTTYVKGDGVPYGKYVVTFVQLHKPTRAGQRGVGFIQEFVGPDNLKNLYNDPQKNRNEKDFAVEVQSPGRTDYEFALSVAGKDPVPAPSEYAVTRVRGN